MGIVQPRAAHLDGDIRWASMPAKDLMDWGHAQLLPAIKAAKEPLPTLIAGKHCQFCPARTNGCPTTRWDLMGAAYRAGELIEDSISDDDLAAYLSLANRISSLKTRLEEMAFGRLMAGAELDGFKLVTAISRRVWKDSALEAMTAKYGSLAFEEPKPLSPAQIEKLPGGKKFTAEHAYKPDAGLTLARDEDRRNAVNKNTKSLFQEIPQ